MSRDMPGLCGAGVNQSVLGQEWPVPRPTVRFSWLWPVGIVVLGALLTFLSSGRLESRFRRRVSANVAALAVRAIPAFVARWDFHPPLFYLVLHFWRSLGADTEFSLRLLPVAFGTLSIVVLYRLSTYLLGSETGLVASFLLAISPFHIWFDQMLRPYTAVFFLTLLSLDALARLLRREQAVLWLVLGLWVVRRR